MGRRVGKRKWCLCWWIDSFLNGDGWVILNKQGRNNLEATIICPHKERKFPFFSAKENVFSRGGNRPINNSFFMATLPGRTAHLLSLLKWGSFWTWHTKFISKKVKTWRTFFTVYAVRWTKNHRWQRCLWLETNCLKFQSVRWAWKILNLIFFSKFQNNFIG